MQPFIGITSRNIHCPEFDLEIPFIATPKYYCEAIVRAWANPIIVHTTSLHHQGINDIPEEYKIIVQSEDYLAEGLEFKNHSLVL